MRISALLSFALVVTFFAGCSSMDQSLELGAATGIAAGAVSMYAGHSASGAPANLKEVGVGSTIGLGIGLLVSYLIHKGIEREREQNSDIETEIHFGDLPPSPFFIPSEHKKAGAQ